VTTADGRIRNIAKEVELTSFVIKELGSIFEQDGTSSLISNNAVKTAEETMKECSAVFSEIDATLKKSKKGKMSRLMLPFRDNKIELLRNHIDKLKSTLQLLMQVLIHGYQVSSNKLDREAEARQREEIKQLLENQKRSTRRYEESLRQLSISNRSTVVGDDQDLEKANDESNMTTTLTMTASAIGSTINSGTLAECVDHVRILLGDIETLQQALAKNADGDDHSDQHQILVDSYFRVRSRLDSVLLGSSKSWNKSKSQSGSQSYNPSKCASEYQAFVPLEHNDLSPAYSPTSPTHNLSPGYSAASPIHSPGYSAASPIYSPGYSAASPSYSPILNDQDVTIQENEYGFPETDQRRSPVAQGRDGGLLGLDYVKNSVEEQHLVGLRDEKILSAGMMEYQDQPLSAREPAKLRKRKARARGERLWQVETQRRDGVSTTQLTPRGKSDMDDQGDVPKPWKRRLTTTLAAFRRKKLQQNAIILGDSLADQCESHLNAFGSVWLTVVAVGSLVDEMEDVPASEASQAGAGLGSPGSDAVDELLREWTTVFG
jgi:hypothetical protein